MSHANGTAKVEQSKAPVVEINPFDARQVPSSPPKVVALSNVDGARIQEMIDLNNTFSALLKQVGQYEAAILMLKIQKKKIEDGTIGMPVMIQVTRTISHAESDKNKVLKHLDDEIKNLEVAKKGIIGTLDHRQDEYVESVLRVSKILEAKVKGHAIKKIQGVRCGDTDIDKAEQNTMDKELKELMSKDKA